MHNLLMAFRSFLSQDVKSENESKYLAILLRVLSILSAFYMLSASTHLILIGYYLYGSVSIMFIAAYFAIFIQTYASNTRSSHFLFNITSTLIAILLPLLTGFDKNFQWIFIIISLVSFYGIENDVKKKLKQNFTLIIVFLCISILSNIFGPYKTGAKHYMIIFNIISALYYGCAVVVIAYCYNKKFNASEEKLYNYNQKLIQMASMDALTKLANRRSMTDYLQQLSVVKNKKGDIFCIAIADLDYFKKINDVYGHYAGDYVLQEVANIFKKTMEGRGKVARWGGEEFLFCFDDLSPKQCYKILDKMREEIENTRFEYDTNVIHVTLTIGLEEYYHVYGIEGTISKADKKLYDGKAQGRNVVIM